MSSPLIPRGRGAYQAFTLIELLTVIAIIGILAAITLTVSSGVKTRAAMSRARVELAVIAQALENYKRQYGDYPQTGGVTAAEADSLPKIGSITAASSQGQLFNALAGKLSPKLAPLNSKVFIDLSQFTLERPDAPDPSNTTAVDNALLDPWGRRYMYFYKDTGSPGAWKAGTYVLYSVGPDGKTKSGDPSSAGVVDYDDADNIDNIYANR